jgi:hypothetical protein
MEEIDIIHAHIESMEKEWPIYISSVSSRINSEITSP